ncbi:MAG: LacI family DNA-binding transcriptional regulator [Brachybacterium sp.]|nr:LacI family DNA-binding transcriptional regulator [Brachybacterium sp.]
MPAVRLTDVAADAGVSLATASRVLNGSARRPGEAVSERVRSSAARLGYVTNAQAQALARSRTGMVGLVVHTISDPYFAIMASAIQARLFAEGIQVLLAQTTRDPVQEERAIRSLIAQRVDALILVGSQRYARAEQAVIDTLLQGFADHGGRIVGIGNPQPLGRSLVVPNRESAYELATSLVVAGHRRFAVLNSIDGIPFTSERTGGFLEALTEAGIEVELGLDATSLDRAGGHRIAADLAAHLADTDPGERPTEPLCVFATTDIVALGIMGELRRRGLRVPEDVGVAGFGGVPDAADSLPALTTVEMPLVDMAEQVAAWIAAPDAAEDDAPGTAVATRGAAVLRASTELAGG